MKSGIILTIGTLVLLAGCGSQGDKASNAPAKPKKPVPPYQIAFSTQAAKPNPAGVTIPTIQYIGNPNALEKRACLVVRFDASGVKKDQLILNKMILAPLDVPGATGALPADYMDTADRGLAKLLGAYCMKGKVKISVALVRSSIVPQASDAQVDAKRLSDWLPVEVVFKNPHPTC